MRHRLGDFGTALFVVTCTFAALHFVTARAVTAVEDQLLCDSAALFDGEVLEASLSRCTEREKRLCSLSGRLILRVRVESILAAQSSGNADLSVPSRSGLETLTAAAIEETSSFPEPFATGGGTLRLRGGDEHVRSSLPGLVGKHFIFGVTRRTDAPRHAFVWTPEDWQRIKAIVERRRSTTGCGLLT